MVDVKLLPVACAVVGVAAACERTRAPLRSCEIAGGWELGAHDPTDRSTNVYITARGSNALDLDEDVRRADGSHGWEVERGRRLDARHVEFGGGPNPERCEIAASCERITCTSFELVRHFCDIAGDWHAAFAHHAGTAHITTHHDDVDLELVGEHVRRLDGLRLSAHDVIVHVPQGEARCSISESCNHIDCVTFELRR